MELEAGVFMQITSLVEILITYNCLLSLFVGSAVIICRLVSQDFF